MKRRMKYIKRAMAWLLTMTMLVTGVDYVQAAEAVQEEQETMLTEVSQGGSCAVSVSDNQVKEGDVSVDDVSRGNFIGDSEPIEDGLRSSSDVLYSGTQAGITWSITSDGLLTIEGEYDAESGENVTLPWLTYKTQIKKAVVTAKKVKSTGSWFAGCTNLAEIDVKGLDTSAATSMSYMFEKCSSLTSLDLSGLDTGNVTNMGGMFSGCSSLTSLDLSGLDTGNVTNMTFMFNGCRSLTGLDVSGFDTGNVTTMYGVFQNCKGLTSLDVSGWDTGNVTTMAWMFASCEGLASLDVSGWDTGSVTTMYSMFTNCSGLASLDVSGWDTGSVTTMYGMFYDCSGLSSLDVSGFKTDNVTDMSYMFSGCDGLMELKCMPALQLDCDLPHMMQDEFGNVYDTNLPKNLSESIWLYTVASKSGELNWLITDLGTLFIVGEYNASEADTVTTWPWLDYADSIKKVVVTATGVETTDHWFEGCSNLKEVILSGFDMSKVENADAMFAGCNQMEHLNTPKKLAIDVALPAVYGNGNGVGYTSLPKNMTESILLTKAIGAGTYCEMDWLVEKGGHLTIYGAYGLVADTDTSWKAYGDQVTSAKITATGVTNTYHWFNVMTNMKYVDLSEFDSSKVFTMNEMFYNCKALEQVDVSKLNTSNVKNMYRMFYNCKSLTELDLSRFDTSKVTDMNGMFYGCSQLTELNLSSFDMAAVTDASDMLAMCTSLEQIQTPMNLTLDIPLPYAFVDGKGEVYWTLPKNQTESFSLKRAVEAGTYYGMDWAIDKDGALFITGTYGASAETDTIWTDYADQIVSAKVTATGVTSTVKWFYELPNLKYVDLSEFDSSKVTDMNRMFYKCTSLTELKLGNFDTSKVTNMDRMFSTCSSLASLDVSKFNTANVTNMNGMFYSCSSLTSLNVSNFDTSKVTDMENMFAKCSSLTALDVSGFNTSKVTMMDWMFYNCSKLTALDVSGFDTSSVTHMGYMFGGCSNLTELNVSGFNTSKVTNMKGMFGDCAKLTSLDVSRFEMQNATNVDDMFIRCSSLQEIRMPANLSVDIKVPKTLYNYLGEPQTDIFPKYQPEAEWYYAVSPVGEGEIHVSKVYPQTYTGKAIKPEIRIYDGANRLLDKKDFTITYKNNTKAASKDAVNAKGKSIAPTIIVKGKGNYTKTETITFDILAKDVADADVTVNELVAVAGKKVQKPVPKLTYNGKKLVNKKDFTVSYPDMSEENPDAYKAPGTYRVVVTGKGNFTGTREITFTITGGTLMSKVKIAKIPNQTYTGAAIEPEIKVTHGKKVLVKGTDYTVSYANNVEIGKATVTVTGMGSYAGSKSATFQITGQSIAKAKVAGIVAKTYNGKAQTQSITVTLKGQEKPLVAGTDYEVVYTKNISAGTATMTIKGVGSYTGTIKKTFKINAYDLSVDESKLLAGVPEALTVAYEKGGSKPALALTFDGAELAVKKDYTLSYANNKKVAGADAAKAPTITVKGKGNFKGSIKIPFSIVAKDLQDAKNPVKINVPDVAYSKTKGKYISKPVLTDVNGKKLVAGTDYEKAVVYSLADGTVLDKKSVVEAGQTVTVTVTGKGNYSGTISATYRITQASFKSAKIKIAPQVYTGKEITLSGEDFTSVKIGKDTLVYGEDFEIVEGSYKNNIKKGTASVTIKGKGNYGGEKTVKFKIVSKELIWFWRLFE